MVTDVTIEKVYCQPLSRLKWCHGNCCYNRVGVLTSVVTIEIVLGQPPFKGCFGPNFVVKYFQNLSKWSKAKTKTTMLINSLHRLLISSMELCRNMIKLVKRINLSRSEMPDLYFLLNQETEERPSYQSQISVPYTRISNTQYPVPYTRISNTQYPGPCGDIVFYFVTLSDSERSRRQLRPSEACRRFYRFH